MRLVRIERVCAIIGLWLGCAQSLCAQAPPGEALPAPAGPVMVSPAEPLQPILAPIPEAQAAALTNFFGGGCEACGTPPCVPGHHACLPCESKTRIGRFGCILYEEICCPDPCYEGRWLPLANAAFFVDGARPVTQTKLRFDSGINMTQPDRGEYFWARADGNGKGPAPTAPFTGELRLNYYDLVNYTEAATGRFSMFVETPYRSVYPEVAPHAAGFSDMNIGTKTLLFDSELFQITFQFRTYIPVGVPSSGLGNGHASLEPSMLWAVNLARETYWQGKIAEWIPLGGDPNYSGAILHYHSSLNRTLWYMNPAVPIIGTMEFNGWSFQHGSYTDPYLGGLFQASGTTYASAGAGVRWVFCDKIDFGVAFAQAITHNHFASQLIRSEFRWRF